MYILKNKKLYWLLFAFFIATFIVRATNVMPRGFFYQHISNFSITGVLFLDLTRKLLLKKGFSRKQLLIRALPFALLNVIIELFIRVDTLRLPGGVNFVEFNTPDPIDMVFGILAVLLVLALMFQFSTKITNKNKTANK
jgi:hypothetical protein